jgi:glycerophosphoryl diester phosphodiesterase
MIEAGGPLIRIGHRGAAALAPENTLGSFQTAIDTGVDWIEFDVLDLHDGTLVLAHSNDLFEVSHGLHPGLVRSQTLDVLRRFAPELPTFDEALAFLAERPGVGLHVDLKTDGNGQEVADALHRHGVADRTFVSSNSWRSLLEIAAYAPTVTRGLTYPEDRFGLAKRRALLPVVGAAVIAMRRTVHRRIDRWLARAGARVAVLNQIVISRRVVEHCHARGVPVIAWTVDDPARARRLRALGVDGIVTNDPRIFSELENGL